LLADVIEGRLLLLITASLLAWQAFGILRGRNAPAEGGAARRIDPWMLMTLGVVAGSLSGLLGIGGGLVIVPSLAGILGMPLKRALGTSLLCIVAMVVPGTLVHAFLGNIDWAATVFLMIGSIPGARIGARIALGTRERTLRTLVGGFLGIVAIGYGLQQVVELVRG
jgi:uncharacterized membrane protein YfcA